LWAGFFLVLVGLVSYAPFFALFPVTRDFPWSNLLMFVAGGVLLGVGLRRAWRQPELYRGKVFGLILTVMSAVGIGLFVFGIFYLTRQLPASAASSRIGQKAPEFSLTDQTGNPVTLAELLATPPASAPGAKANGVLLIFYRGHW
jgi:hypothetical protein